MTAAKKRFLVFGLMALAILLVAVLAPVIATHDPNSSVLADAVQPPSGEHWFGTDKMGRDLFSRVIYGTRTSILSTMALVLSILLLGGALGIVAGYVGGTVFSRLESRKKAPAAYADPLADDEEILDA